MAEGWSRTEVEAIVSDYFQMLELELRGESYNKAAHRQALLPTLHDRSAASIEFKHANVSAVLIELGFPYIGGYKPRSNYQQLLREIVEDRLAGSDRLIHAVAEDVERVPAPSFDDILGALTAPPRPKEVRDPNSVNRQYLPRPNPLPVNFLEREANNRKLGRAGEEFVVAYEQARLTRAGAERLAAKVEHIARTKGDGAGFDVLSFEASGAERFVEVKTTKYGAETPFFLSRNEVGVSDLVPGQYHLYRVFDFRQHGRLFTLGGSLRKTCSLEAESYRARVAG